MVFIGNKKIILNKYKLIFFLYLRLNQNLNL